MDNRDFSRGALDRKMALLIGVLLFVSLCSAYVGSWFSRDRELRKVDRDYKVDMVDEERLLSLPGEHPGIEALLVKETFAVQRLADERWMRMRQEVVDRYPWLPENF